MTSWASSTSLITGAGNGMGRGLVRNALDRGGRVVAWDVDGAALADLAGEAGTDRLRTAVVDVTDREAVDAAAVSTLADGPVDILVNNAGVVCGRMLTEIDPETIERVLRVNTLALFWTSKAFLPAMIARNAGHVVTVASAAGLVPLRRAVAYTASKHAAVGFHDAVRQELRVQAPGVRTTLITPFFVDTGMFHGVRSKLGPVLPIVEEGRAVRAIAGAVERDRKRLIMPSTASLAYLSRLFPVAMSDTLLDWLGISASMDGFVGRPAPAVHSTEDPRP
jgi:all-trans-retinol dehydrogenase (NAD+)